VSWEEVEALSALAGYAKRTRRYVPEVVAGPPCFERRGAGPYAAPAERCGRNDVAWAGRERWLVVSGSNMSGKSTLTETRTTRLMETGRGAGGGARRDCG